MKKHKTGIIFALVILASGAGGALLSLGVMQVEGTLLQLGQQLDAFLRRNAIWGMGLLLLVQLGFGAQILLSARRTVSRALDAVEDDALLDKADSLCDRGVGLMTVSNIVSFLCMGVGCAGLNQQTGTLDLLWVVFALVLGFTLSMALNLWFTNRFIKLTGLLYPEKQVNILSMRFQKEWFATCDEAERQLIGRSAYHAMRAGQGACTLAMTAAILLTMLFGGSLLVILALAAVWLTMTISYLSACHKYKRLT